MGSGRAKTVIGPEGNLRCGVRTVSPMGGGGTHQQSKRYEHNQLSRKVHIKFPANRFAGGGQCDDERLLVGNTVDGEGMGNVSPGRDRFERKCLDHMFISNDPSIGPEHSRFRGLRLIRAGDRNEGRDYGQRANTRIIKCFSRQRHQTVNSSVTSWRTWTIRARLVDRQHAGKWSNLLAAMPVLRAPPSTAPACVQC